MPPAPANGNRNAWIADEVAHYVAAGMGFTEGSNLFVGELPEPNIDGTPEATGLYLIELPSTPPDMYLDTETHILEFWCSDSTAKTAYETLRRVFDLFQRKGNYPLFNWYVYFSSANDTIRDEGRGREGNKLFALSITFICRNLNNIS